MAQAPLDDATLCLVDLAAAVATGNDEYLRESAERAVALQVSAEWVDELVLQSVLMVGWPRALMAMGVWRSIAGHDAPAQDPDIDYDAAAEWYSRGQETCRIVYGENYDKLRANVRRLHPALDAWMIIEGYVRTLSRPGLDLIRRELLRSQSLSQQPQDDHKTDKTGGHDQNRRCETEHR